MKKITFIFFIFLFLPLSSVYAEIALIDSIDWAVLSSDLIAIGKVKAVRVQQVTLQMEQVLKGEKTINVTFSSGYSKEILTNAHKQQYRVLVFLQKEWRTTDNPQEAFQWVLRDRGDFHAVTVLDLVNSGKLPSFLFTLSFTALKNEIEITQYIQKVLQQWQGKPKPQRASVDTPSESEVFKKYYSGSSVFLMVPLDEALKAACKEWRQLLDLQHCEKLKN